MTSAIEPANRPDWQTALALIIILLLFPLAFAHLLPAIDAVRAFYSGDRSQWWLFWTLTVSIEWLTLLLVFACLPDRRQRMVRLGLAGSLTRTHGLVAAVVLGVTLLLAVFGSGGTQEFLSQMPRGVQMFVPPSEVGARLFWIIVCLTAAVVEETLWRGVALNELKRLTGSTTAAVLIASLSFAYFHGGLLQGGAMFAYRFLIAVGLSVLALIQGHLRGVILIHFIADATVLAAIELDWN